MERGSSLSRTLKTLTLPGFLSPCNVDEQGSCQKDEIRTLTAGRQLDEIRTLTAINSNEVRTLTAGINVINVASTGQSMCTVPCTASVVECKAFTVVYISVSNYHFCLYLGE